MPNKNSYTMLKRFPQQLGSAVYWEVVGMYVNGRRVACPKKFNEFESLEFMGLSGNVYHAIGNKKYFLILNLKING